MVARAYDNAGNLSDYTTSYFYYDATPPSITLSNPSTGYINSLNQIDGQASDSFSGLLNTKVGIQINPPSGNWWD